MAAFVTNTTTRIRSGRRTISYTSMGISELVATIVNQRAHGFAVQGDALGAHERCVAERSECQYRLFGDGEIRQESNRAVEHTRGEGQVNGQREPDDEIDRIGSSRGEERHAEGRQDDRLPGLERDNPAKDP